MSRILMPDVNDLKNCAMMNAFVVVNGNNSRKRAPRRVLSRKLYQCQAAGCGLDGITPVICASAGFKDRVPISLKQRRT